MIHELLVKATDSEGKGLHCHFSTLESCTAIATALYLIQLFTFDVDVFHE